MFIPPVVNTSEQVTLSCSAAADVRTMRVIGDFNGWSAPGDKMRLSADGQRWETRVSLCPGVYRYVFLDGRSNVPVGSEFKKRVQVLVLTPPEYKQLPGVRGDGLITPSGLAHRQDEPDVYRLNESTYRLTIRTRKDDVAHVSVSGWTPGGDQKIYPMKLAGTDPLFDYYSAKVVVNSAKTYLYRFLLDDGAGIRCFDTQGLSAGILGGSPFQIVPNQYKPHDLRPIGRPQSL